MSQHVPVQRIPEEEVAAILERAAELDRAARESFDVEAIRTAALEAGISRAAVDRAMDEYLAGDVVPRAAAVEEPKRAPRGRRLRGWLRALGRPALHGLVALMIGAFIGGTDEEVLYLLGFVGWLAFAGVQVWRRRSERRAGGYLGSMALVTLGALVGAAATGGDEDFLAMIPFAGLLLSGYGTLYIKLRVDRLAQRVKRLADWVAPAT